MRKIVRGLLVLTISVAAAAAHADDLTASARRLTEALLHSKLETIPAGLSSPSITRMSSNANGARAGIVGEVKMSFPGRTSNAEIRYAVFANSNDARRYSMNFGRGLTASHQRRIFFPYLPDADCAQRGHNQLCVAASGNVFTLVISNGVASAKTPEGQTTTPGVSAGTVGQFALAHLQSVRKSIEQSAAATPSPGARPGRISH
jgi:hypothetical protein